MTPENRRKMTRTVLISHHNAEPDGLASATNGG